MAKTMIASQSTITDGQIENVANKLRDALRKHRAEFGSENVQEVLGVENLGMELLAPFRTRIEAISNLIVRTVKVDRSRTPQEALDATGRRQYTDKKVVAAMPRTKTEGIEEVEFLFFKPRAEAYVNGVISDDCLDAEFKFFGVVPDPIAQAAVNEADPAFADDHPNGTHWKDKDGKYCFLAFRQWADGVRRVFCHRFDDGWDDDWVFGGVRKPAASAGK